MRLWIVVTDLDRLRAREVIQREHYLSDPGQGMILACAFVDNRVQESVRRIAARKNVDPYKISWQLPPGGIVGCAIVGTMWHGNPRDGRQLIATELGVGNEWWTWKRPQIIQKFRIAWASRFAVDEPYQRLGIGTLLGRHLKLVTRRYRLPCTDFLEVITTEERPEGGASISRPPGGFLVAAGYTPLDRPLKSDSMKVMNLETGFRIPKPAIKRYYVADLRDV